jgi:hypothetical protein
MARERIVKRVTDSQQASTAWYDARMFADDEEDDLELTQRKSDEGS